MPHLYDKAPPAYAKDPYAWDYTREKMEDSSGLPYDQWEGRHFAGAAVIYKNVVKKYGESLKTGAMTMPKECVDCGNVGQHYENDYICVQCRDLLEKAGSIEEAYTMVKNPSSLHEVTDALMESLSKLKKGQPTKRGSAPWPGEIVETAMKIAAQDAQAGKVSRNYKAMNDGKLMQSIRELEADSGASVAKARSKGENPADHLRVAREAAAERGM